MFSCLRRPPRVAAVEAAGRVEPAATPLLGSNLATYFAGGGEGRQFDDKIFNRAIAGAVVWTNDNQVTAIQLNYAANVYGQRWGGSGPYVSQYAAPVDTFVNRVDVWVTTGESKYIKALRFFTGKQTDDEASGIIGNPANADYYSFRGAAGEVLLYASGKCGDFVDNLSFTFGPSPTRLTNLLFGSPVGARGAPDFFLDNADQPRQANVTGVKVTWSNSGINTLQFQYGGVWAKQHGKVPGGSSDTFLIPDGHYLSQVQVYADTLVRGLKFYTNRNVFSQFYGVSWGTGTMMTAPAEAPSIIAFGGYTGDLIDQLFPVYSVVQADRYVITDITYDPPTSAGPVGDIAVLGKVVANNYTSLDQTTSATITTSISESSTWTETNSATVGFSVTVEAEAGAIFSKTKVAFTMSASWTGEWSSSRENTITTEHSVQQQIAVPKYTQVTGTLVGRTYKASVPWKGTKVPYIGDTPIDSGTPASGVLQCATVGDYAVSWTQGSLPTPTPTPVR